MSEPTLEQFQALQEKEYGQYVALVPINHDGARAYNPGDPVPASNVKQYGYDTDGLVAKTSTKAAQAVMTDTTEKAT